MAETPIGSIAAEIERIAVEHGYEGPTGMSIVGAMDALADTLAGEDVHGGATIAEAVRAIAPHIGSGGGGTQYGENYATIARSEVIPGDEDFSLGTTESVNMNCELWAPSVGKLVIDENRVSARFLEGATATYLANPEYETVSVPTATGPVDAAIMYMDADSGEPAFEPYDGVTYDATGHRFVIPIHDIPAAADVGGFEATASIIIRASIVSAAPPQPI